MGRKESNTKWVGALALFIWSAFVLSAFYVTQRPIALQVINGIGATLWTIGLTAILLIISAGFGYLFFERIGLNVGAQERFILGTGIGLGLLGLVGYGLGAAGLANKFILVSILFGSLLWIGLTKIRQGLQDDLNSLAKTWRQSLVEVPPWIVYVVIFISILGFLFTLLPPADGFDGLLYHLALPERLLADKQILPYNILQFWFPSLIEGDFIWALGLGSEQTAQLIHWSFSILTLLLIWEWSRALFGNKTAWWALAILISMPSLPWLSSWAYTDLALTFMGLACLYLMWRWRELYENQFLLVAGIFAGMAMGIKYTSFILPLLCVSLIMFWEDTNIARLRAMMRFALPALLVALPWYLRNWLVMGNPFYPFVFAGRFWDPFRTAWTSGKGTSIGWDIRELFMLPLTTTLGYRDQNFFDGRFGPLFLLLFPVAIWAIWKKRFASLNERNALFILTAFSALNYGVWVLGVIQTEHLLQARLLWPGLIPFAIPIGLGLSYLSDLDLPRLRISFIITIIIALVILVATLDNSLSLIFRRPLAYAFGMESRQAYFDRIQPRYATTLELVNSTPKDSFIYFLFEPRSYSMTRKVHPDPINDNLMHDFYLYNTAEAILKDWQEKGYTHVLINFPEVQSSLQTADVRFDVQFY